MWDFSGLRLWQQWLLRGERVSYLCRVRGPSSCKLDTVRFWRKWRANEVEVAKGREKKEHEQNRTKQNGQKFKIS